MTVLTQRQPAHRAARGAAVARDVHAWEAHVRRTLRPTAVELVDGSRAQRERLVATGVRRGTLVLPEGAGLADAADLALEELLTPEHGLVREADLAAGPVLADLADLLGDEAREAHVRRVFSGASRGRAAYLVPHAGGPTAEGTPAGLGVLFTDSPLAVLSLLDGAEVGPGPAGRVEAGEPWTAAVHSMALPLDDEHGHHLRDDVAWPAGTASCARLRGGAEVWSSGSPVAWT